MLNTPKLKTSDKVAPQTPQPVAPFPLRDQTFNTEASPVEISFAKPPQHALMPQNNPFDINSELIPFQEQEVEVVFKTPELDDFLLPPALGDQITDTTLMHRYLPKQPDIDRIMEQINKKISNQATTPLQYQRYTSSLFEQPTFQRYIHGCRYE